MINRYRLSEGVFERYSPSILGLPKLIRLRCLQILAAFCLALSFIEISAAHAGAECKFKSYSVETLTSNGSGFDNLEQSYFDLASKAVLRSVSPGAKLSKVKPGGADISLVYLLDNVPYKTPSKKMQTALDLLSTLPPVPLEARTLNSPWLQLSLSADCKLRSVIIFNIRQMIADQANLAGVRPVVEGIVTHANDPDRYLPKYYNFEVISLGNPKLERKNNRIVRADFSEIYEQQQQAANRISTEFPPDLFWFFSLVKSNKYKADGGTFFSILDRNTNSLKRSANIAQVQIVNRLIRGFLSSDSQTLKINSILEIHFAVEFLTFRPKS